LVPDSPTGLTAGALYRSAWLAEEKWVKEVLERQKAARQPFVGNRRRQKGAFYTPKPVVEYLVHLTLDPLVRGIIREARTALAHNDLRALTACCRRTSTLVVGDPACGSGRFLLAAFRRLQALHYVLAGLRNRMERQHRLFPKRMEGAAGALASLYGMDVDEEALKCAARILTIAGGGTGGFTLRLSNAVAPAVEKSAAGAGDDPWQVLKHADVILSNPPWGAEGAGVEQARALGLPGDNINIFSIFVVNILQHLAPGGRMGLVLPRNFFKGHDYSAVRRRLLDMAELEWIIDAGTLFPGVLQEVALVVATRTDKPSAAAKVKTAAATIIPVGLKPQVVISGIGEVKQSLFRLHSRATILIHTGERTQALLQHMEKAAGGHVLGRYVRWHRGLEYGKDGALVRCPSCGQYNSIPKKKRAEKPCRNCRFLLRGTAADYRFITVERDTRHTVPVYGGAQVRKYRLAEPLWLEPGLPGVDYKKPHYFRGRKVLVAKVAPEIRAALDDSEAYVTQGVYILRAADSNLSEAALLGYLNSSVVAYYYEHRYNDRARLTTNVVLAHLLDLPVPAMPAPTMPAPTLAISGLPGLVSQAFDVSDQAAAAASALWQTVAEEALLVSAAASAHKELSGDEEILAGLQRIDQAVGTMFRLGREEMAIIRDWYRESRGTLL